MSRALLWCRGWGSIQLLSPAGVSSDGCGNAKQKTIPKASLSVGPCGAGLVHPQVPFLKRLPSFWWAWERFSQHSHLLAKIPVSSWSRNEVSPAKMGTQSPRLLKQLWSNDEQPASYVSFN